MDIVTKIITLIGSIIGVASAVGIMIGINNVRGGMANDDSRQLDKGVTQIVTGGAIIIAVGGIVAYVILQLNKIVF